MTQMVENMVEKVFLTDARRAVLDGTTDLEGNSLAVEKSRIRKRARLALAELTEVAQSDQIDNRSVFDPEELAQLIYWVGFDPYHVTSATVNPDDGPRGGLIEFSEKSDEFRKSLYFEIDGELRLFHSPERGRSK